MTKAKELRDTSPEELRASLDDLRKQLFELRNKARQSSNFEQSHMLRLVRKDIARTLTVLKEKEMQSAGAA